MSNGKKSYTEELLEQQVAYQRRVAKDLHSLYFLVIANIIFTIFYAIKLFSMFNGI